MNDLHNGLQIREGARGVALKNGRTVGDIMKDLVGTPAEQELLDIIDFLTERLVHSDSERF